jgi:integrase
VYYSPAAKATRRLRLGDAVKMTLAKARALARAAMTAVEDGGDPHVARLAERERERDERRKRAEERRRRADDRKRRAVTFGKLCRDYVEWRTTTAGGRSHRPASPRTVAVWRSMLKLHVLPMIGETPVGEVNVEDFARTLEAAVKRGGPSQGPRVREMLSAVWHWLESRGRLLGVRLPAESPLRGLPRDIGTASKERERVLTPGEIWRFWSATEGEGLVGLALRYMLLTATRVKEATHLPWSEVDTAAKLWTLAADRNKGARVRAIPLSAQALHVLTQARSLGKGEHAFALPNGSAVTATMKRLRAAMGGEHWEPRDLRRTAATLVARLGADPFVVALTLGHAQTDARVPSVTRVYLRWRYDDRVRDALDRLGQWIEETVSATEAPGAVVEFRR